jgi:acyl-coenzyme A thioesterase 9
LRGCLSGILPLGLRSAKSQKSQAWRILFQSVLKLQVGFYGEFKIAWDLQIDRPVRAVHPPVHRPPPRPSAVTRSLWRQRYRWNDASIAAASSQTTVIHKPPKSTEVVYPFSMDPVLREHYRSPWGRVRVGRMLEDMDSLAGYVAFEHADDDDDATRPPLLATASVEAITIGRGGPRLEEDMKMSGQVVWTGATSLDVRIQATQGGKMVLGALLTFVAREAVTGAPHPVNQLRPEAPADQELYCERQRTHVRRKAQRANGGPPPLSLEAAAAAGRLLEEAKSRRDLPALADPHAILAGDTALEVVFVAQPQQRNLYGRIFGGFLMRRALELAHCVAYMFTASRTSVGEGFM